MRQIFCSTTCPSPAVLYNGMCYVYIASPAKKWIDAEAYCQKTYGGHLASVHGENDQTFLFTTLAKNCTTLSICPSPYGMWVGGNNYGNIANWTWSDGTVMEALPRVTKNPAWPAQPDAPATQQCMVLV